MLRIVDGPKDYISANADGPYAFCQETDLKAYNATEWLFNYALDAVETHGASWADFGDAEGILSSFVIKLVDDETCETHEQELQEVDITPRGVDILNAAAKGEDVEALFEDWRDALYEEANSWNDS